MYTDTTHFTTKKPLNFLLVVEVVLTSILSLMGQLVDIYRYVSNFTPPRNSEGVCILSLQFMCVFVSLCVCVYVCVRVCVCVCVCYIVI